VKAPGFGDRRKAMLQDIAIVTGGQLIAQELGIRLENVTLEHLGRAARVVVGREHTTIVGGKGEKRLIDARCQELRKQIADTTSDYDREKLEERLAKISGGVAVIRVGAPSEAEMKSRREAFDDAISATRAAIAEGIVPGAGLALLRAMSPVETEASRIDGDERAGMLILRRALEVPTRHIAENSGADGGVVVEKMCAGTGNFGFDAARNQYVDLVETGIVDPTKVVRLALENAVSVAGVLLLTEATMTDVPEPRTDAHPVGAEAY
jgi:chaperonin GroEL